MMDPRRIATIGILCSTLLLTGWRVAGFFPAEIENSSAALIELPRTPSPPAAVEHAGESPRMPTGDTIAVSADVATPVETVAATATDAISDKPAATPVP